MTYGKQKMNPKISVIMSAYNSEAYIAEAIESILNQTVKDFEFIIFEDGSTDNTKKIVQRYSKKDKRIIPVYNKRNVGYVGFIRNLNRGLNLAKGKYIARMDSDDISLQQRFKIQYNYLEKNRDIFLIGSRAININPWGKILGITRNTTGIEKIKEKLEEENCIIHPSIMFRNEKILKYREKALYCEDYDAYLQLLLLKKNIENLNFPLIKYRLHDNTTGVLNNLHQKLFAEKIREFYLLEKNSGKDIYDEFNPEDISRIKIKKDSRKLFIEIYIQTLFKLNKMDLTREKCLNYFYTYGFLNKMVFYYIISFFPVKSLEFIRKIVWKNQNDKIK